MKVTEESGVYVLHFDRPICSTKYYVDADGIGHGHTTQHYCGSAANVAARIERHREGRGARLTEVARERGIGFSVVRVFVTATADDARELERAMKRQKNTPRLCPECRPGAVDAWLADHPEYAATVQGER